MSKECLKNCPIAKDVREIREAIERVPIADTDQGDNVVFQQCGVFSNNFRDYVDDCLGPELARHVLNLIKAHPSYDCQHTLPASPESERITTEANNILRAYYGSI